jgi:hypothetical protein
MPFSTLVQRAAEHGKIHCLFIRKIVLVKSPLEGV